MDFEEELKMCETLLNVDNGTECFSHDVKQNDEEDFEFEVRRCSELLKVTDDLLNQDSLYENGFENGVSFKESIIMVEAENDDELLGQSSFNENKLEDVSFEESIYEEETSDDELLEQSLLCENGLENDAAFEESIYEEEANDDEALDQNSSPKNILQNGVLCEENMCEKETNGDEGFVQKSLADNILDNGVSLEENMSKKETNDDKVFDQYALSENIIENGVLFEKIVNEEGTNDVEYVCQDPVCKKMLGNGVPLEKSVLEEEKKRDEVFNENLLCENVVENSAPFEKRVLEKEKNNEIDNLNSPCEKTLKNCVSFKDENNNCENSEQKEKIFKFESIVAEVMEKIIEVIEDKELPDSNVQSKVEKENSADKAALNDYLIEEKEDILNPDWEHVKNLNTTEERYKEVRSCWKSRTVPDPNKNLTYHSYKKRHCKIAAVEQKFARKRKRTVTNNESENRLAKRPCTYFVDKDIQSAIEQKFYTDEFSFHQQMYTLNERRNEICKFFSFYKGLNDSGDPTVLSEKQCQELKEIENIYKQFDHYYN